MMTRRFTAWLAATLLPAAGVHAGELDTYTLSPAAPSELDVIQLTVESDNCYLLPFSARMQVTGNQVVVELDQDDQCFAGLGHQAKTYPLAAFPAGTYVLAIRECGTFSFPLPGTDACQQVASIPFAVASFAQSRRRIPAGSTWSMGLSVFGILLAAVLRGGIMARGGPS